MTHNAAVLGLHVDPAALYRDDDPEFALWLGVVIDRVHQTQQEADRKARS